MGTTVATEVNGALEVQALLEGLARVCVVQIRSGRVSAKLYASGVRYQREPMGRERWQSAVETLRRGAGDCEDLVAWRVAELRCGGEWAEPMVYSPRPGLLHCVVKRSHGRIEDPSKKLGMRGRG